MTNLLNTKIILSAATILAAAALIAGATFAFFSDTETSENNVFTAGDIDLKVDNSSYIIDYLLDSVENPTGAVVANLANSWPSSDLTDQTFFDFSDVKPGDFGEDTISLTVGSNDAYVCAAARITDDLDNLITEPEAEDGDLTAETGELDSELNFAFWADDGDNVLETDEYDDGAGIFLAGTLESMGEEGQIALADTGENVWGETVFPGEATRYIGKAWCFGTFAATPVTQDGFNTSNPTILGTGFTCDGSGASNIAQTDSVEGDLQFFAVQARNNEDFTCDEWTPEWPTEELEVLDNE